MAVVGPLVQIVYRNSAHTILSINTQAVQTVTPNTWSQIVYDVVAPTNTVEAWVTLAADTLAGNSFFYDDASFGPQGGGNLMTAGQSGMESAPIINYWDYNSNATLSQSSAQAHSGTYSLLMTPVSGTYQLTSAYCASSSGVIQIFTGLSAAVTYEMSTWVYWIPAFTPPKCQLNQAINRASLW